jgi:hypothetical protein
MAKKWQLIDNNKHKVLSFKTKKEMFDYAKDRGVEIKPGRYEKDQVYFIESYQIIPGQGLEK